MTNPHFAGATRDEAWFAEKFADIQRQINELHAALSLRGASLGNSSSPIAMLFAGGQTDERLTKVSDADYDWAWEAGGANVVTGLQADPTGTSITQTVPGTGASNAEAEGAIAIGVDGGTGADATGKWDIAIGGGSHADSSASVATDEASIAIGDFASANYRKGIAIGPGAFTGFVVGGTAIGQYASVGAGDGIAIGTSASVGGGGDNNTVVIGHGASSGSGIAIGCKADDTATSNHGRNGIAIGGGTTNNDINGIAIGTDVVATGGGAIAIGCDDGGTPCSAGSPNAIAIGGRSDAQGDSSVALGHSSDAKSDSDIAIGPLASTRGPGAGTLDGSIAIGEQAAAGEATPPGGANFAIAIGGSAVAEAEGAIRIGMAGLGSNQAGRYATIIGSNAFGPHDHAVALGSNAAAAADGAVALGTDSSGAGASAAGTDDFVLGTANHNVKVPGKFGIGAATPAATQTNPGTATGTDAAVINAITAALQAFGLVA